MKALITGGAGFLGMHVAERLLHQGHEVLVIDNFATGHKQNLAHLNPERCTAVEGTIADTTLVNQVFEQFAPTHVIHSAAAYKDPNNWVEDINTNITGTINIVQASQRLGVKRLIYFQTALIYGRPQQRPITLSHPIAPFTSYSISKAAGEHYVRLSGLPFVSLRLANIYGPGHLSGPIPTFHKRLKAKQPCTIVDARRDFLEIEDFLTLLDAILVDGASTGCFNVSSGKDVSIKELFDKIVELIHAELPSPVEAIKPGEDDVSSLLLDPAETERLFHWKAQVQFDEGLRRLIQWYDQYGVVEAYTHLRIKS